MRTPNNFFHPIISATVEPMTEAARKKMAIALANLAQHDPTLHIQTNSDTGQTILSGISEQHLELIVDRMMREYGIVIELGHPRVIYCETIRCNAEAEGRYIRQTGGSRNFGHVMIRISPNQYGKGYEFSNDTISASIPSEYINPIDEGIQAAMRSGILTGSKMIDVKVSLFDGSYHEVESSDMSFKIAASMAFKEAARKAKPVLLEPMMDVEVTISEEYVGTIIGDLNNRRGRIEGMEMVGRMQVIKATVPLSTMLGYATHLGSLAQGRANCSMQFKQYEEALRPLGGHWSA